MDIASYIEHTNLSPVVSIGDIDQLVAEAKQFRFLGVCVPPFWVKRAKREIGNDPVLLVTVAGFPLGYSMTETKLDEIKRAIDNGADEVDVVWNISSFKTGIPWTKIEIAKCGKLAHDHQKNLKVIIETSYLSDEEIIAACKLSVSVFNFRNCSSDCKILSTNSMPSKFFTLNFSFTKSGFCLIKLICNIYYYIVFILILTLVLYSSSLCHSLVL